MTIAEMARLALIWEVQCEPKAGLVCPNSNGAHSDMDYDLFIKSIEAISPFFEMAEELAIKWTGTPEEIFYKLRKIGVKGEKAMLGATNGVNTHKGALFSFLILVGAASLCKIEERNAKNICKIAADIASPSLLDFEREAWSKGEGLYKKLGEKGVRGEAASGFQSALNIGLPTFRAAISRGCDKNEAALSALTQLMANCRDTNVLSRGGTEGIAFLQREATEIANLEGDELVKAHGLLGDKLIEKNISPGGCADLLAVTFFLNENENAAELAKVLGAREERYYARISASRELGTTICITMCVPISIRGDREYSPVFENFCKSALEFLQCNLQSCREIAREHTADGEFVLLCTRTDAKKAKKICIEAENTLYLGRIFDMDVMDGNGVQIGREELLEPPRTCLICGEKAAVCVSKRIHSKDEVARVVKDMFRVEKCKNTM